MWIPSHVAQARKPLQRDPLDDADRACAADRRELALVVVVERRRACRCGSSARRACPAASQPVRRRAGRCRARRSCRRRQRPPGGRSRSDRARRRAGRRGRSPRRRPPRAGARAARPRRRPPRPSSAPRRVRGCRRGARSRPTARRCRPRSSASSGVTPSETSCRSALRERLGGEGAEHAVACLDEQDARRRACRRAVLARQRVTRELRDLTGHLDAGGAGADDAKVSQACALRRSSSTSAASNALRIRSRRSSAPSSVFSSGAYGAQSSWPK